MFKRNEWYENVKPDQADFKLSQTIVNLTEMVFNNEEKKLLEKSVNYAPPKNLYKEGILIECERIISKGKEEKIKRN